MALTPEGVDLIKTLEGHPNKAIAAVMGTTPPTLARLMRSAGLTKERPAITMAAAPSPWKTSLSEYIDGQKLTADGFALVRKMTLEDDASLADVCKALGITAHRFQALRLGCPKLHKLVDERVRPVNSYLVFKGPMCRSELTAKGLEKLHQLIADGATLHLAATVLGTYSGTLSVMLRRAGLEMKP